MITINSTIMKSASSSNDHENCKTQTLDLSRSLTYRASFILAPPAILDAKTYSSPIPDSSHH
jgi:hypothetical protein